MSAFEAITELASNYFDGLYEGNIDRLAGVFHDRARLHVVNDDGLTEMDIAKYLSIVAGRASPKSIGAKRNDQIVSISVTSPIAAVLVVRLLLSGKAYNDQLALIKDEGRWKILSKIYYLEYEVAP